MLNRRLIDRQTALLRHLTSETFMFGTSGLDKAALDPDLHGMDLARLRLEAEFSFHKRMSRIRDTFGRTAALYGNRFGGILREFAAACPPRSYERYLDARDFFDWYAAHRADDPSVPPWAVEVARVEIALARARTFRPSEAEAETLAARPAGPFALWYRTHPCVALARCRFDVGPLFQPGKADEDVEFRDVPLAVLASHHSRRPEVMELVPEAFELLQRSPEWSCLELGKEATPMAVSSRAVVMNLAAQGLMLALDGLPGRNGG